MAKLNNKQKLNIIAEHQNGKSLAELSKVYGVSKTAISKILNKPKSLQKLTESLQEEQEQTILEWSAYWQSKSDMGQKIADKAFELLLEKLSKAYPKDLMAILEKMQGLFDKQSKNIDNGSIQVNISIEDCKGNNNEQS